MTRPCQGIPGPRLAVRETLIYMGSCQDQDGLFGFWPGSPRLREPYRVRDGVPCCLSGGQGAVRFQAPGPRHEGAHPRRSDPTTRDYLSGYSSYERVEALAALDGTGAFDEGYANDLLAASAGLPLYSQARLYLVLQHRGLAGSRKAVDLGKRLAASVVTKKEGKREIFAGFVNLLLI